MRSPVSTRLPAIGFVLQHDAAALDVLRTAHPHLSYLWDSEVQVDSEATVMRGAPALP